MKFRLWLESFGSRFNYQFPTDPENQMNDFYLISHLSKMSSLDKIRNQTYAQHGFDIGNKFYGDEFSEEDKIDYNIKEIQNILIPKLKNQLLSDLIEAMSDEMLHFFDNEDNENLFKNPKSKILTSQEKKMLKDLYDSFNISNKNSIDLVNLYYKLFLKGKWPTSAYGGKKWAYIAKAWIDLNNSQSINNITVQIDHIYDLQHNTGSLFNKLKRYEKPFKIMGRTVFNSDWLSDLLDKKANLNSLQELVDGASPSLRNIAKKAIYLKTRQSYSSIDPKEKIRNNPILIKHISNPDEEIQIIAVEKDPLLIKYISNPTFKTQMIAVQKLLHAFDFIDKPDPRVIQFYRKALE